MMYDQDPLRSIYDGQLRLWGINRGITELQARQLVDYANQDPEVAKFTSDRERRFKDKAAFEDWTTKERVVYTMTDEAGNLAGIIWYGKEEMPKIAEKGFLPGSGSYLRQLYETTFAIRTYGEARGVGLAHGFMDVSYLHLQAHWKELMRGTPRSGLWLETSETNSSAKRAYIRFGYEQITVPDSNGKILMVLPKSRAAVHGSSHQ